MPKAARRSLLSLSWLAMTVAGGLATVWAQSALDGFNSARAHHPQADDARLPVAPSAKLTGTPQTRQLSLGDRIAYQRAIEEVYWRHRIWPKENSDPKPLLERIISPTLVREKVEDYLRKSQLLVAAWQQPITFEQLQAEMERVAKDTKQPEVLREIFIALDNDPTVIAECLARPLLADRLLRDLSSSRASSRDDLRRDLNFKLRTYGSGIEIRTQTGIEEMSAVQDKLNADYILPEITGACTDDSWASTTISNAPSERYNQTAIWTGTEMIVWGGFGVENTGGRYFPATDSWVATAEVNAPGARGLHTAIWTGNEMIVWGGYSSPSTVNTGGRYNPITNSWSATTLTNAPAGRHTHTAVWTGSEMIVWGGYINGLWTDTGGRYDPTTNSWIATTSTNRPSARGGHTAVWTGTDMIIWGGYPLTFTDAKYNPISDSWTNISINNAPEPRSEHAAVWTGTEMIVWGGFTTSSTVANDGGRYNPSTDSWNSTALDGAPAARRGHKAIWTGREMIIWGGLGDTISSYFNSGGRYNPDTDSWVATTILNAPSGRVAHTAIWTGNEMIAWGGSSASNLVLENTGGRYCAQPPPSPTPCPACTPTPTPSPAPFVGGHYFTSNYDSRVIKEYDNTRAVVASYTLSPALGYEVRGLAFGTDGLLYATLSRGSSGFAVFALRSDLSVAASYAAPVYTGGNLSYGKIAMDDQYLYVCGQNVLTRFLLGDSSSGTTIYTEYQIFDVKPLPNGHLFVASANYVDEITRNGGFVRRIQLTGGYHFLDIRGIEFNPETNVLFVTHLGYTDFYSRIMRVDATTGSLLNSTGLNYADDLFLDSFGNLLVGSRSQSPTFFSQDLLPGNTLNGGQQMFVTQYQSSATPAPSPTPTPTPSSTQALNISTRMRVETGDNVLIGGFIVTGNAPKDVVVRGIGPSLTQFGLTDVLADPTLELHGSNGGLITANDNWQDNPADAAQLTALGVALQDRNESGIVATLQPGAYTAILAGKNGGTGVGLVEVYDTNRTADSQLANISTRGFVRTGDTVMIGGFILDGSSNTQVVVRGIGPSLTQFGLSPVLIDPTLELYDANGTLLVSNDDWQDDPASASQLGLLNLAPQSPKESGIVRSLPPGAFTAILAGKDGGIGLGLVEIFNVH